MSFYRREIDTKPSEKADVSWIGSSSLLLPPYSGLPVL